MSDNDRDTLRRVAWSEVCPWLIIFRTFRLAIGLRVLLPAAVAVLLMLTGWSLLGSLFSYGANDTEAPEVPAAMARQIEQLGLRAPGDMDPDGWMQPHSGCPWLAIDDAVPNQPSLPGLSGFVGGSAAGPTAWGSRDPYFGVWAHLSRPLWEAWRSDTTLSGAVCLLLCGLWAVAVWALFGGAITRIAAVDLACEERVGLMDSLRFALSKWLSHAAAPLLPVLGVVILSLLLALVGLPLREVYVGAWLAALLWPLVLLAGVFMAILLLGLIFGWPLMWPTISTEGTDSFDALSRSYAYVFGRPLHYLFYAAVAALLGMLGWLLVQNFAAGVVWTTYWAASWGSGGDRIQEILGNDPGAAGWVIRFWVGCVKLLAVGFLFSYFWSGSTAIYLLLRRNVDATEMDEVFLDEEEDGPTYGLPPMGTDEAGAPVVDEELEDEVQDEAAGSAEHEAENDLGQTPTPEEDVPQAEPKEPAPPDPQPEDEPPADRST